MPLQATSGAASYDAFGGGVPVAINYIEDVFSAYIYTNDTYPSNLTITNGIDLSGKGGLVWMKNRSLVRNHNLYDTARGALKQLRSDGTDAQITNASGYGLTAFNANGFSLGTDIDGENYSNVASWTFRKQPKFFDVVTGTTDASGNLTVSHNLGSVPGFVIVKRTDGSGVWYCYHTSLGNDKYIALNTTAASVNFGGAFSASSTSFSWNMGSVANSATVVYLFAHNAGGFGLTGTDNVISCGSYVGSGSAGTTVNLGWEPQWVMIKKADDPAGNGPSGWVIMDNMRGLGKSYDNALQANTSTSEAGDVSVTNSLELQATGFKLLNANGALNVSTDTYIYIAIRRGPMKVPTDGTKVFSPNTATGSALVTTNFPVDTSISSETGASTGAIWGSRLQGTKQYLSSYNTNAEGSFGGAGWGFSNNTGLNQALYGGSTPSVFWNLQRAPGFFDEVCYSPPSTAVNTYAHNLAAVPELMIFKTRDSARRWVVYTQTTGNTQALHLNTADAVNSTGNNYFNSTSPTASVFTLDNGFGDVCNGGGLGVAYLFATCPGVSKVFSFTGNGSSQTINCGFTGGSRFVLIKRTDSTGDWYVWDSARGIVSGNDPHLSLNTTAAEVTTDDSVDTDSTGFIVNQNSATNVNVNGATYIGLAVA